MRGINRWPVNSLHKGPVTWKMFPFDDVIMCTNAPRGALPLWVSRYAPWFCPPIFGIWMIFLTPKFDHVYHFIQILLGPISKAPHFQHVDVFFAPKIDQLIHFIQILLGPILNFEHPYCFLPGVPHPPPPGTNAHTHTRKVKVHSRLTWQYIVEQCWYFPHHWL